MHDVRMCGFERRTSVEQALRVLTDTVQPLTAELVAVQHAVGRVSTEDLHAACAVPHFPRAMMDGFAVIAESTFGASDYAPVTLTVRGEVRAGHAGTLPPVGAGEAIRITTGAPIPPGADAVLMAEYAQSISTENSRDERIAISQAVSPQKHIGPIGEDIAAGDLILSAGRILRPQDAGVLASVGIAQLPVVRRPRVRIIITGNELLKPGEVPQGSCIVDSNSVVLRALKERDGGCLEELVYLPDDPEASGDAIVGGEADVVLISGGSSVGPEDHAPRILAQIGTLAVHGIAMRPSSPAGFGSVGSGDNRRLVFLLPGNPVSCLCAYEFFAGPAIRRLGGRTMRWPHERQTVPAAAKFVSVLGRTDYTRVTVDDAGAHPLMTSGASLLSSTTRADGVVIVPDRCEGYAAGELVEVLQY